MAVALNEQYVASDRARTTFATLVISPDDRRMTLIQQAAAETGQVVFMRCPVGYPPDRELTTIMNHAEPDLVLLDLFDSLAASDCAQSIRQRFPRTAVIGVGARHLGELTLAVPYPPTVDQLERMIHRGMHIVRGGREPGLFVFLPAKAGCGASTVALNIAGACAAEGKRVLLIDADLHSGALGAMVDGSEGYSLQQVLRGISELDRFRLEEAVSQAHGFDLLLSDGTPVTPWPVWADYFRLLEIARPRYEVIVADLPEVVNPATQEFVQRAQGVYVVTTQELVPVKLAPRRLEELAAYGAAPDTVHMVVNRWQRAELDAANMEKVIQRKMEYILPNDYRSVRRAVDSGELVSPGSGLGKAIRALARSAMGVEKQQGLLAGLFGKRG